MIARERLCVLRQRIESRLLRIHFGFQRQHIRQSGASVLTNIAEWEIADVHAMYDQWSGDAENARYVVRTQLLIFGQNRDAFASKQVAEKDFERRRCFGRQRQSLIAASAMSDPHLDLITFSK